MAALIGTITAVPVSAEIAIDAAQMRAICRMTDPDEFKLPLFKALARRRFHERHGIGFHPRLRAVGA